MGFLGIFGIVLKFNDILFHSSTLEESGSIVGILFHDLVQTVKRRIVIFYVAVKNSTSHEIMNFVAVGLLGDAINISKEIVDVILRGGLNGIGKFHGT